MADTNINIYLHDNEDVNPTNPKDPGTTPDSVNPTQNKGEKGDNGKNIAAVVGAYVGKQALNFAQARVGQATHSNLMQQKVNAGAKIVAYGAMIVANPALGAAAFAIDLIGSTIDYAHKAKMESNGLSIINERAGNINRSRWYANKYKIRKNCGC